MMPFLRNVTAGRGIPDERLAAVAEHYYAFGGRSPINDQNRALLAALRAELDRRGIGDAAAVGQPQLRPVRHRRPARGARARRTPGAHRRHERLLVLLLLPAVPRGPRRGALRRPGRRGPRRCVVDKVRPYCEPPRLRPGQQPPGRPRRSPPRRSRCRTPAPAGLRHALDPGRRWTTRPVPATARATSTGASTCELAAAITDEVNATLSRELRLASWSTARGPGRRRQPWLEPDVNDRLEELAAEGVTDRRRGADRVRLRPHGGRATTSTPRPRETAERARAAVRARADRRHRRRVRRRAGRPRCSSAPPRRAARRSRPRCGPARRACRAVCRPGCCPNLRAAKPALCGSGLMPATPGAGDERPSSSSWPSRLRPRPGGSSSTSGRPSWASPRPRAAPPTW